MIHFDVKGYFEELYEYEKAEFLGTRRVEFPNRALGSPGTIDISITEPVTLRRGAKEVTFKASPKKPLKCRSTLQILCGRQLSIGDKVKIRPVMTTGTISNFNSNGTVNVKIDTFETVEPIEGWKLSLIC